MKMGLVRQLISVLFGVSFCVFPLCSLCSLWLSCSLASPQLEEEKFADACAGCHTTAVEAKTRAFSALSLDCYVCHGDVPLQHSKDTALVHLSKKRQDPARVVTSICAQCHVRTGKSRSTG